VGEIVSAGPARTGAIRFQSLTLGYDRHPAVHHLDGTIAAGDLLAVVGPNGAGKSTLLKGIVGEIRPLDGTVEADARPGAVAYLPQAAEIDRSFPLSVLDLVAMGLWRPLGAWRSLTRQRPHLIDALAAVGLTGFEDRPIGTLSGGQFQRALFARLILQDARIILLDEPFTGIDERTTADLLALIRGWHREGRTVVAALHDLAQVRAHFPSTLVIARRPIAWGPTREVLTPPVLARALRLSEAWDEAAAICRHEAPPPTDGATAAETHDHGHGHEHHGHDHGHAPHDHHDHPHAHPHAHPHHRAVS
jgi:zinc/manganese transport system ATP-binding protein